MHTTAGDGGAAAAGGLGLIIYAFFFLIHLALCYAVGKYGEKKGSSFWLGALLSFFTSPLIGFIVVLIIGNNNSNRVAR